MGALKPGCDRAREWVSLDVDDELSEVGRARLRAHLARCPACAQVAREVRALATALADAPLEEPSLQLVVPPRRIGMRRIALAAAVVAVVSGGLAGSLAPEPQAALRVPYFEQQLIADAHEPHGVS
jgi:ferric-dicitrate binding protein FerR (iron transport regulator)